MQFKIVEFEPGKYKIYEKCWLFWVSLAAYSYAGQYDLVFESLANAKTAMIAQVEINVASIKDKEVKRKHRKRTYFFKFDDNGNSEVKI